MRPNPVIVIPAYRPDERLPSLTDALKKAGLANILVVDDGSGTDYDPVFRMLSDHGIRVIRHPGNRGKGAALRTGIAAAAGTAQTTPSKETLPLCVVTADADGQHAPEDIVRVAVALAEHPDTLVLGTRDFSGKNVPWKSRAGNRISSVFFRLATGRTCPDTQTGLRGIPGKLLPLALAEDGDRYEYEMNFLTDAAAGTEILQVPIRTIYENNNEGSHFHPVRDAVRVYSRPLRFAAASAAGCAADLLLFVLFRYLLSVAGAFSGSAASTAAAVIFARLFSGGLNFLLNRKWSFRSRGKCGLEAARYAVLFTAVMLLSAAGTTLLSLFLPAAAAKVLIDSSLFVLSYRAQKQWVFKKEGLHYDQKDQSSSVRGISRRLHDIYIA
ncbi:MAG: bifunctional glycosyltransferase family 2/GtrA family protein [Lachnospiraceae bacterium]|nr:bifunctional glycosyltransferase family 2/GtrA family protein [Lachnospiraceae bacterium]